MYRQFSSKEELFVLTVTDYLDELAGDLARRHPPTTRSRWLSSSARSRAYASFCHRYPAFIDSSLSLMQRPARELHDVVSESVWLRLGQGMAACVDQLIACSRAGAEAGVFDVEDPDYMANVLWTQVLGAMHLARIRVGVRAPRPAFPSCSAWSPSGWWRPAWPAPWPPWARCPRQHHPSTPGPAHDL